MSNEIGYAVRKGGLYMSDIRDGEIIFNASEIVIGDIYFYYNEQTAKDVASSGAEIVPFDLTAAREHRKMLDKKEKINKLRVEFESLANIPSDLVWTNDHWGMDHNTPHGLYLEQGTITTPYSTKYTAMFYGFLLGVDALLD